MKTKFTITIIILFLIASTNQLMSQTTPSNLFMKSRIKELSKEDFANKYSIPVSNIKEYYPVELDKKTLTDLNNLSVEIGNDIMNIKKDKLIERGRNSYSFIGTIGDEHLNRAIITIRNDFVAGTIHLNGKVYILVTFKDMEYYLLRIEDKLTCGNVDEIPDYNANENYENKINRVMSGRSTICPMRIIVLYTPSAEASFSNISNFIQHAFDVSNDYLENSLVDEIWELAYTGLTDYTEVYIPEPGDGRFMDLDRFRIDGDGYMDEIHDLRETFSADICVLISECQYETQCGGVAADIDANKANAFCLVHAISGYFHIQTFAHEIGHLLACRHHDSGISSPYPYGHGFYNAQENFQTIMGNVWGPTFAPNFSNPDVLFQGHTSGTANWNDCARVMEQEIPEKVEFLQPENNVTITADDVDNIAFGDVISKQTVTIQGVTIPDGAVLKVRSGETTINNGFILELGAELEIINETVNDCP